MKENPRIWTQAFNLFSGSVKKMDSLKTLNSTGGDSNTKEAMRLNTELHRDLGPFYIIAQALAGLRRMTITRKK